MYKVVQKCFKIEHSVEINWILFHGFEMFICFSYYAAKWRRVEQIACKELNS